MKGLTDVERFALNGGDDFVDAETVDALERRGLCVRTGLCWCCGTHESQGCECTPDGWFDERIDNTADGDLALRLDAAARQLTGVSA